MRHVKIGFKKYENNISDDLMHLLGFLHTISL
jgi:hypothetical protein